MQHLNLERPTPGGDAVAGRLVVGPETELVSTWWPARSKAGFVWFSLVLAASLTGIALGMALVTQHLEHSVANALVRPYLIGSPILIGLVWKLRRPDSPFAMLLIAFGVVFFPLAWQASNDPLIHTLGVLFGDTLAILATFYLALAFPVGRLQSRADWVAMGLMTLALGALLVSAIGRPMLQGAGPLSRCSEACPPNPIQVVLPAEVTAVAAIVESIALLGATLLIIAILVQRYREAPRPRRRALVAVAFTSLLFFPVFFVYQLIRRTMGAEAPILEPLGWVNIGVRITFALGFAVALIQAELFAGSALRRFLDRLADRPSPDEWRDAVAEALDDPALKLGYWDPLHSSFRQSDGSVLEEPTGPDPTWVTVTRDDLPVAAFTVDEALRTDPELLRAAANATLVAVENGVLAGELRSSRRAAVEAGDTARRRIAQDLHDSAQQRLIALRIHLELARERLRNPDEQAMLQHLGTQLDDALGDIRAVSRGTRTEELHRDGLATSLEFAFRSIALPVTLAAEGVGRYGPAVEEAVYFSLLEALQNVAKHCGGETPTAVTLADTGEHLAFAVEDEGPGFDPGLVPSGHGLASIAMRIGAVGGRVRVESAPGVGTTITGSVPIG